MKKWVAKWWDRSSDKICNPTRKKEEFMRSTKKDVVNCYKIEVIWNI